MVTQLTVVAVVVVLVAPVSSLDRGDATTTALEVDVGVEELVVFAGFGCNVRALFSGPVSQDLIMRHCP